MSQIKVWAHRGASGYAPENTLEAFQIAVEMNADCIELDIQLSKDGELVVIHDETIDRVSNGTGWVKDYTIKELKTFNYNRTHPEYKYTAIPTLGEVYSLLKDTNLNINVELKNGFIFYKGIEEKVLELTNKMGMQDRVLYSSFNHYSVMRIKELYTEARLGFLYADGFINMPEYCKKMGVGALHPSFNNLKYPNLIESCKKNGVEINVWNVRDNDITYCCKNNINAIITNYPDKTQNIVYKYEKGE